MPVWRPSKFFSKPAGIRPESLVLSDGSGLSRNDMVNGGGIRSVINVYEPSSLRPMFFDKLYPSQVSTERLAKPMKGTPAEK